MIVIPILQPKKFRKQVRTESEITDADFSIYTEIKFEKHKIYYPETKILSNGFITVTYHERIEPEISYGFQSKITISGYEYDKNKKNINEYVVNKLKQRSDYKKCLSEYIEKENANREYTIDTFVAHANINPVLHYSTRKIEEYIPEY